MSLRFGTRLLVAAVVLCVLSFGARAEWRSGTDPARGLGRVEHIGPSFIFTYLCSKAENAHSYILSVRSEFGAGQLKGLDRINVNVQGETEFIGLNGKSVPFNGQISEWKVNPTSTGYELTFSDNPKRGIGRTLAHLFATTYKPVVVYVEKAGNFNQPWKREADRLGMLSFNYDGDEIENYFNQAFEACGFAPQPSVAPAGFIDVTAGKWEFGPTEPTDGMETAAYVSDEQFETRLQLQCSKERGYEISYDFRKARGDEPLRAFMAGSREPKSVFAVVTIDSVSGSGRSMRWSKATLVDGIDEWLVTLFDTGFMTEFENAAGVIEIGLSTADPAAGRIDLVGVTRFGTEGARDKIGTIARNCEALEWETASKSESREKSPQGDNSGGNESPPADADPGTWQYFPAKSADDRPRAFVRSDNNVLGVTCDEEALISYYFIPGSELVREIDPARDVFPVFWIDPPKSGPQPWPRWFKKRLQKIGDNWAVTMSGRQFVDWVVNTRREIHFGISPKDPEVSDSFNAFNIARFSAKGSTATVRQVIKDCEARGVK